MPSPNAASPQPQEPQDTAAPEGAAAGAERGAAEGAAAGTERGAAEGAAAGAGRGEQGATEAVPYPDAKPKRRRRRRRRKKRKESGDNPACSKPPKDPENPRLFVVVDMEVFEGEDGATSLAVAAALLSHAFLTAWDRHPTAPWGTLRARGEEVTRAPGAFAASERRMERGGAGSWLAGHQAGGSSCRPPPLNL